MRKVWPESIMMLLFKRKRKGADKHFSGQNFTLRVLVYPWNQTKVTKN